MELFSLESLLGYKIFVDKLIIFVPCSSVTMTKPVYMAATYATQMSQHQNLAMKAYNVQPVAMGPSVLAAGSPFAPAAVHDNQSAIVRSQTILTLHPTSAISSGRGSF